MHEDTPDRREQERRRPQALRRLGLAAVAAVLVLAGAVATAGSSQADLSLSGVPSATCADGDLSETAEQGRVPTADYASGRAAEGYRCNTVEVGHHGERSQLGSGGYKVQRYTSTSSTSPTSRTGARARPSAPSRG